MARRCRRGKSRDYVKSPPAQGVSLDHRLVTFVITRWECAVRRWRAFVRFCYPHPIIVALAGWEVYIRFYIDSVVNRGQTKETIRKRLIIYRQSTYTHVFPYAVQKKFGKTRFTLITTIGDILVI